MWFELHQGSCHHVGIMVCLHPIDKPHHPFRLLKSMMKTKGFTNLITQCWVANVRGMTMFWFNSKLRSLKAANKFSLVSQSTITGQSKATLLELAQIFDVLDRDPNFFKIHLAKSEVKNRLVNLQN